MNHSTVTRLRGFTFLCIATFILTGISFAEWPHWRGPSTTGEWNPASFPGKLDEDATKILWKQRINGGYAGVTAAKGRVFTMDYSKQPAEKERILCLNADTGEPLWDHSYDVRYASLDYGSGPRASVTIDGDHAYTLGAVGHALCLEVATGRVVWSIDTAATLRAQIPTWGLAASPVVWKDRVILHVGAQPDGCYIALDKLTGKEIWRSNDDPAGYCTPLLIEREGVEQFICWTPEHIHGIAPEDGTVQWSIPYNVKYGVSIASPIFAEGVALVCGYWHGTRAIQLDQKLSGAKLLWSDEENICGLMSQPLYKDSHVYLLDKANGLVCFELATGKVLWNDTHQITPADRNPQASLVWADKTKDLVCALNANGELVVATCTPQGFTERSRMELIGKTWAHPAFSGNRIYARSDREIVAAQLW